MARTRRQGAITAAKIFAMAAFKSRIYRGGNGPHLRHRATRRARLHLAQAGQGEDLRHLSIETPDVVVVLDHLLLTEADVTGGLKPGGLIVLNTPSRPGPMTSATSG